MQFIGPLTRSLSLAAGLFLAGNATVSAQSPTDAEPPASVPDAAAKAQRDDLITVTATKTPRDVDSTPVSVDVLPAAELSLRQPRDLEDLVRYEPGVEVNGTRNSYDQGPVIRGLDGDRVLTLLDGVRQNFGSGHKGDIFFEPAWVKRVEIVRGPGSALYGSDALGGVFSMESIDASDLLGPQDVFALSQSFGYADNNRELSTVSTVAGRLGREGIGRDIEYLFGFGHREAGDNYRSAEGELAYTEESPTSGIAKLAWWLSDADRLELAWQGYRLDEETSADVFRLMDQQSWSASWEHEGDNPLLNLRLSLYYNTLHIEEDDRSAAPNFEEVEYSTLGVNLQNSSTFELSERHKLILTYGGEWYRDEETGSVDGGVNLFFPNAEANSHAIFGQAQLALWDELLTIIPGIRADWYERSAKGREDVSADELSMKLGAALKLDDELGMKEGDYVVLHGSYGEGFRAPNFQELYIDGAHPPFGPFSKVNFAANPELQPETTETLEGGVRVKVSNLRAGVTFFQTKADGFIDYNQSVSYKHPNLILTMQGENLDGATLTGSEWYAEWQATESVRLWGNYTRVRGSDDETREALASVAPDVAKLGVDWTQKDLGLTLGARSRIYADYDRPSEDRDPQSGFALLDLVGNWTPTASQVPAALLGISVGVVVENVTNEDYTWYTGSSGRGINPVLSVNYTKSW